MSKHDLKARQLQVEQVISPLDQPIVVGDLLKYDQPQTYETVRDIPDIEKVLSLIGENAPTGSVINETNLIINAEQSLTINWQEDPDPDPNAPDDQTWADRHGNLRIRVFGLINTDGVYTNYTPNLSFTKDQNGLILSVTISEMFPGIVTII